MSQPLLYAIEADAARALGVPPGAGGLDGLYEGLQLGVYSALRTYQHCKFLDLDRHIERTRRSMARLGWSYEWDEDRFRRCLDALCSAAPFDEMRVRFDLLAAPARVRGSVSRELIALAPFEPPPRAVYAHGVAVLTTDAIRRDDPLTKAADFVEQRKRIEATTPGAYERLIVSRSGEILEGLSSNFYIVRAGVLQTAGHGVLEGITRRIVLELARERGIAVDPSAPSVAGLRHADEAAISSSSRGLVPVVSIDGEAVGGGTPGPVITQLSAAYEARVASSVRRATG